MPRDADQIIYVWIDALINYLSDTHVAFSAHEIKTWPNPDSRKTHFIAKNVWKFHAIYWPALLLSAGLELPDEIVIHGFLTIDGQKISKSVGNVIDPAEVIGEYGADSLRFYLLRAFSPFEDGDVSAANLKSCHNSYLVNGLGNLLSRLVTLAVRQGLPRVKFEPVAETHRKLDHALKEYRFDEAVKALWFEIDRINAAINSLKPWESIDSEASRSAVVKWLQDLWNLSYWLEALLPRTAQEIQFQIQNLGSKRNHLFRKLA